MRRLLMRQITRRLRFAVLLPCVLLAACATGNSVRPTVADAPGAEVVAEPSPAPAVENAAPAEAPAPAPETTPVVALEDMHGLQRLAGSLDDPQCRRGRVVDRWISRYQQRPDRWDSLWRDKLPLLHWVQARIAEAGLPGEFALIPMVESHFRPDARNGSNAGMWQLSAITARGLGLGVDARRDERLDPIPATETAIILLQRLMERFGDWRLAAMAYNAGEYRVAKALESMPADAQPSAAAHQPPGLSNTTYEYMAKLEALGCLVSGPEHWGLSLPTDDEQPLLATSIPDVFRSVGRLASVTGINEASATALNPSSQRYRIDPRLRRLLLPAADSNRVQAWNEAVASGAITPIKPEEAVTHVVASGDSLWTIARRHRLSTREIQSWNALPDGAVLHPGQILRLEP